MRRIATITTVVAVVALGAGASVATAADTPTTTPSLIDAVAAQLGVTPDKLRDAFKNVVNARIDAAVAAGRLTQEQADKLKQHIADGKGLGLGARERFKEHLQDFRNRLVHKAKGLGPAAAYLGLTNQQLREQLRAGKSLAELVPSGKTVDGLVAAITAPAKERIAKAEADKKLTPQQADKLLTRLTEGAQKLVQLKRPAKTTKPA